MLITALLNKIKTKDIIGSMEKDVVFLSQDSREIEHRGSCYFAVPGTQVDGHDYIDQAIKNGASVVVCEILPVHFNKIVTFVVVENVRKSMGEVASHFYGNPSKEITIIAVTGTNGKTSIATYASQILQSFEKKVLLLSTAGDYFNSIKIHINRKAPSSLEVIELQRILRHYVDQGATHCCLEATSQGLDQDRLSGVDVDIAIFSNLERDHLDYHKTIENYAAAKKKIFDDLKKEAIAISNYDDPCGKMMIKNTKAKVISYGNNNKYDYSFDAPLVALGMINCNFNAKPVSLPVVGLFNIYNLLVVYSLLCELGFSTLDIIEKLNNISGVPGRMEQVINKRNILALVDYAHSPGAVESVLSSLKEIPHNNIITVIGCGGDRDRTKRPLMAAVAQQMSDHVIYTSDNPRTESLDQIFSDMSSGINQDKQNFEYISSREEAIVSAIKNADKGDIILVAGKGHEDYQIIGTKKIHFNDVEIMTKYLS
jgi:UDP-N-acetylmuramoyl-L-alanyl-D-glutamate--2,6-diaminopimelate ligase